MEKRNHPLESSPLTPTDRYPPDDNYWCCGECHRRHCADCGQWHCNWFEDRCPKTKRRNEQEENRGEPLSPGYHPKSPPNDSGGPMDRRDG